MRVVHRRRRAGQAVAVWASGGRWRLPHPRGHHEVPTGRATAARRRCLLHPRRHTASAAGSARLRLGCASLLPGAHLHHRGCNRWLESSFGARDQRRADRSRWKRLQGDGRDACCSLPSRRCPTTPPPTFARLQRAGPARGAAWPRRPGPAHLAGLLRRCCRACASRRRASGPVEARRAEWRALPHLQRAHAPHPMASDAAAAAAAAAARRRAPLASRHLRVGVGGAHAAAALRADIPLPRRLAAARRRRLRRAGGAPLAGDDDGGAAAAQRGAPCAHALPVGLRVLAGAHRRERARRDTLARARAAR